MGGGALRIMAILVVAPLLRHRARPGIHVQSALAAPCRSSCRTVEDFLDCHADHGDVVSRAYGGEGHADAPKAPRRDL
jgi:hypothetical protein